MKIFTFTLVLIGTVPISYGSVTVEYWWDRWDRQVAWWVATCLSTDRLPVLSTPVSNRLATVWK